MPSIFFSSLGACVCPAPSSQAEISPFISLATLFDGGGHLIPLQSAIQELATWSCKSLLLGLSALCNTSITSLFWHRGSLTSLCVACLVSRVVIGLGLGGPVHPRVTFHIHHYRRVVAAGVDTGHATGALKTPHLLQAFCLPRQRSAGS